MNTNTYGIFNPTTQLMDGWYSQKAMAEHVMKAFQFDYPHLHWTIITKEHLPFLKQLNLTPVMIRNIIKDFDTLRQANLKAHVAKTTHQCK